MGFPHTQKTRSFERRGRMMDIHRITHKLVLFMKYFIGETVPKEIPHPRHQSQSQLQLSEVPQ